MGIGYRRDDCLLSGGRSEGAVFRRTISAETNYFNVQSRIMSASGSESRVGSISCVPFCIR